MIWLTFFQDLQEKVSRDWISTKFDTDLDTADVIFLKITIFLQQLTAHTASNYHVCSGHTDGWGVSTIGANCKTSGSNWGYKHHCQLAPKDVGFLLRGLYAPHSLKKAS